MIDSHSYEVYKRHLTKGDIHPQEQGLSPDEFESAIADPTTTLATVSSTAVPQIVDIQHFGWLNQDFFKRNFSDREVVHLVDYGENDYGLNTRVRLGNLASRSAVVIIEVPSSQDKQQTQETIHDKLVRCGVSCHEPELLGTQTYFAGKTYLTRESQAKRTTNFIDTFTSITERGDVEAALPHVDAKNGIWLHDMIEGDEADRMLGFYEDAYEVLNDHPCRQGLDPDTFRDMLRDPTSTKIVSRNNSVPETLFIVTDKIEELTWVNYRYYQHNFADEIAEKRLIWFPGIATDPLAESLTNSQKISSTLVRLGLLGNFEPTIAFDFCDRNTGTLNRALEFWLSRSGEAKTKFKVIADQKYYAVKLMPEAIQ